MLAARDEGFIQITQAGKMKQDLRFVERLAAVSGRPVIHNAIAPTRRDPMPHHKSPEWLRFDPVLREAGGRRESAGTRTRTPRAASPWRQGDHGQRRDDVHRR